MDLRKLKTLVDLVSESNISELEITEADGKVRIVKADVNAARPGWAPGSTKRCAPRTTQRCIITRVSSAWNWMAQALSP